MCRILDKIAKHLNKIAKELQKKLESKDARV